VDFTHYTDKSVELAMDLVNTFDIPYQTDDLDDLQGLERFLSAHEMAGKTDENDLARVKDVRTSLRRVFEAGSDKEAAEILNRLLAEAHATPRISAHDDFPVHMHFEPVDASVVDQLAATTAMGLAVVLCDFGRERLGICASDSCRYAFIDVSKNRRKQYCGDKCATRENVAAYRARRRAGHG
jgi:predicted RNA-binding Zn ribbon-like protein